MGISALAGIAVRILTRFDVRAGKTLPTEARLADARSFLVLRYERALGSAVNATVMFEALRRLKPDAHITVACNSLSFEVLQGNPFIDELILTPDPATHFASAALRALAGVWRESRVFDCLITSCDDRPRIEMLALLLGRRLRVGHGPERTFDHALHEEGLSSVITEHLRVVQLFGAIEAPPIPRVFYGNMDVARVRAKLVAAGWDGARPLVVIISQGSGGQPTEWYEDRFALVADRLAERYGAGIVFTGVADQAVAIDRIRSAMAEPSINLAGAISIAELSALIAISGLIVTLDTGTMHLARGCDTPMVVIASAWQPAHLWLAPLQGDRVMILRRDHVPCALCAKFYCATRECLDEITVDDVMAAASRLLETSAGAAVGADRTSRTKSTD